jgi:hypothetical protein
LATGEISLISLPLRSSDVSLVRLATGEISLIKLDESVRQIIFLAKAFSEVSPSMTLGWMGPSEIMRRRIS